jgi:hypothetical protein
MSSQYCCRPGFGQRPWVSPLSAVRPSWPRRRSTRWPPWRRSVASISSLSGTSAGNHCASAFRRSSASTSSPACRPQTRRVRTAGSKIARRRISSVITRPWCPHRRCAIPAGTQRYENVEDRSLVGDAVDAYKRRILGADPRPRRLLSLAVTRPVERVRATSARRVARHPEALRSSRRHGSYAPRDPLPPHHDVRRRAPPRGAGERLARLTGMGVVLLPRGPALADPLRGHQSAPVRAGLGRRGASWPRPRWCGWRSGWPDRFPPKEQFPRDSCRRGVRIRRRTTSLHHETGMLQRRDCSQAGAEYS